MLETKEKEKFKIKLMGEEVKALSDLTYNDLYRQKTLEYKDKPSIVSDTMFKTMFQREERIKYSAYIVSKLTNLSYEELLKNMKLTTNELPKRKKDTKGQRGDFVAKIDDLYINIEVNNNKNPKIYERNLGYLFKLYDQNIRGEEKYNMVVQINFNNFAYKESKNIIDIFYLKNQDGIALTKKIIVVNLVLPNVLEKCYTLGIESLTELEKFLYGIHEKDIEKLKMIVEEVEIVREYVSEAIEVVEDPVFGEAYDHELANMCQSYEDGFEDGTKRGLEQGKQEKTIEMIKAMHVKKISLEDIASIVSLSIPKVKQILDITDN